MTEPALRITAPRKPEQPGPYSFPLVASVAPVVVAIAMWLVTHSPFALLFAALGPVVAVASLADSRIQGKRMSRKQEKRFAAELELAHQEVAEAHEIERSRRVDAHPSGSSITAGRASKAARWSGEVSTIAVSPGRGVTSSNLLLDGVESSRSPDQADTALEALARFAASLEGSPLVVDARQGIGLFGVRPLALAAARSIVVQLAWALSPRDYWWALSDSAETEWGWLQLLPHPRGGSVPGSVSAVAFGKAGNDDPIFTLVIAETGAELPGSQRVVIRVEADSSEIVANPDRYQRGEFRPDLVAVEQAQAWAQAMRLDAAREGLVANTNDVPRALELAPLFEHGRGGLECTFVAGESGPIPIDLVAHGPHAIVGGTTGSGKSEFLISWILSMAANHSPAVVNFLLVDFKGGSAFEPIASLPHVVGVLTDLDEAAARRALESLRAELRHRERELARIGVRSVESSGLPRLVVVIDELAAMMGEFPELHALFTDIAARGRSLGVHLILCTQRPAAVARDGVLANADLRVSLRVNNRADSTAVVGTDAAAGLSLPGRAVVCLGLEHTIVQTALSSESDVGVVVARWPGPWLPRRPWCAPLPAHLGLDLLPAGAIGMVDRPDEQRTDPAVYDPVEHGHLFVLGTSRAGKSTALATIAEAVGGATWLPSDVEGLWDALARVDDAPPGLLVLDDLDSVLPRFGEEHRGTVVDRLVRLLRDGPARGIRVVIAAQRLTGELQLLAALMPTRLLLRQPNKQEHLLAGGDPARFSPEGQPGRGEWFGRDIQIAAGTLAPERTVPGQPRDVPVDRPLAIVSGRPAVIAGVLRASFSVVELSRESADPSELAISTGGRNTAVIGDPDQWQSRWGAIGSVRQAADIVFDGCSIAEFKALTRSRELPPPLAAGTASGWLLAVDGSVSRVRLPL